MTESIEQRIKKAMAELESVQEAVARAEDRMAGATATVRSRDRSVEVVIGPQGELAGLKFLDNKYRSMNAAQLAASVMEAAERGRARMARQVMDVFEPLTRAEGAASGVRGVDLDWDRVFGSALAGEEEAPGRPRRSADRLRDEIHEDGYGGHHGGKRS